jgi:hypothetical protein
MATKQRIAIIKGTFAKPGMSKNRRIYTKQHIEDAVNEAQALIDSGNAPTVFSMMTHHGARNPIEGDVTRTAGQLTKVGLSPEGFGTYEAELADTAAGRDIAALTTPERPYLKTVSMAAVWKNPRTIRASDGGPADTGDGFSLKGIDFTNNPGIDGADISSAELAESTDGTFIFESIEEDVFVERVDETAQGDNVTEAAHPNFADPGYNGEKALPLDTPADIRTSWVQIHRKAVTESYTPKQVQRMRGKVKGAAQKAGLDIVEETNLLGAEIMEAYTSVCVDNGPADLRVSAYVDDPSKLQAVTQKVAIAAMAALYSLDPDNDGDIDLPGGDTDDGVPCPSCNADMPVGALFCPTCGQAVPPAESAPAGSSQPTEEAHVAESTETEGAATESTLSITQAQLDEAVAAGAKAALEAAGVKPTEEVNESEAVKAARKLIAETDGAETEAETPAPAGFTKEQVTEMVTEAAKEAAKSATEAALDVARKEIQEAGPRRRGFVPQSILEESADDLYGADSDLTKLSKGDLEKLAETVAYPLIAR